MKKTILFASIAGFIALSSFTNIFHNEKDLALQADISSVEWVGEKIAGKHTGTIKVKEGSIHLHNGTFTNGSITIDMTTIACTDLKKDEGGSKLEGHLNSPDFFDVANHKTAVLNITSVVLIEGNKHTISGDLTIKGITKPISFPATVEFKDDKLAAYATLNVDRTLYDIKYGSGQFFEGLGDKMIKDNFIINFKIAAK